MCKLRVELNHTSTQKVEPSRNVLKKVVLKIHEIQRKTTVMEKSFSKVAGQPCNFTKNLFNFSEIILV